MILAGHILFTLLNTALFSNIAWLMPMLVRLRFGAADAATRDWQTTLITAAVPTFMVFSIFWNEVLRRTTLRTYLLIYWLATVLPLGCAGFVHSYGQLLACHVVAMIGLGSWAPVNGKLLKDFYADHVRGRVYAVLNIVALGGGIGAIYLVGRWLNHDPDAFRLYLPAAAIAQLLGVAILVRLARRGGLAGFPQQAMVSTPWTWQALLHPIIHMGDVLRADRSFRRYEQAFMTYGAAFMLCDALLPVLATTRLGMEYKDYAYSTQMTLRTAMLAVTLPTGWLLDRFGAVRTSGAAFAVLTLYPLLLLAADGPTGIGVASVVYGLGMGGVQMGWMLGPVELAGRPDRVPHYVAIHTTMVGLRGVVFQGLGMLLYRLTGSFVGPLLAAAAAFAWAAAQMWRVHAGRHHDTRSPFGDGPHGT